MVGVRENHARLRYLLLGGCGSGMSALAEILTDANHILTGMDQSISAACQPPFLPHADVEWLPWSETLSSSVDADVCVFSPAVGRRSPLVQQAVARGIQVQSLHECLVNVYKARQQLCVAGTHGKSTTTAMLSWVLESCGRAPGCFIGGRQIATQRSGQLGQGQHVVLESCEFNRSFLTFSPAVGVLTGIERDHFDCFPNQDDEDAAFVEFAQRISSDGVLIYRSDCRRSRAVARSAACRTASFSLDSSGIDWNVSETKLDAAGSHFQLQPRGRRSLTVTLSVPGRHNIANAVAAIAAAAEVGVAPEEAAAALAGFRGVHRRFERRGVYHGMVLVDDYAHHPTAVRETLRTARQVFPNQRIVAVFEPHQVVRTRSLFLEFAEALQMADEVLLLPVFAAREHVARRECCRLSGDLVRQLNERGTRAFLFAGIDQILSRIDYSGKPSDVLLTMGAGRTNLIHDELNRRLQRHSVA
ncbi:MAG: hypothetical protein KDA81_17960 [Planctomycetaceae bacterium]|nr:hypothetical protein [Planctomycetaceae bacterium]